MCIVAVPIISVPSDGSTRYLWNLMTVQCCTFVSAACAQ